MMQGFEKNMKFSFTINYTDMILESINIVKTQSLNKNTVLKSME